MKSTIEQNNEITFHLGNPESILAHKEIEVHAFHERIKKIIIDRTSWKEQERWRKQKWSVQQTREKRKKVTRIP